MDIQRNTPIATFTTTSTSGVVREPAFPTARILSDSDDAEGISRGTHPDVRRVQGSLDDAINAAGQLAHERVSNGADQTFGVLAAGARRWDIVGLGRAVGSGAMPVGPADPVTPQPAPLGPEQIRWSLPSLSGPGRTVTVTRVSPALAAVVGVAYERGFAKGNLIKRF